MLVQYTIGTPEGPEQLLCNQTGRTNMTLENPTSFTESMQKRFFGALKLMFGDI